MEPPREASFLQGFHRQRYESNDPFTSSIADRVRNSRAAPHVQNIDDIPLPTPYPIIQNVNNPYYDTSSSSSRPLHPGPSLGAPNYSYSHHHPPPPVVVDVNSPTDGHFHSRRRHSPLSAQPHFRTSRSSYSRSRSRSPSRPHRPYYSHHKPTDTPRPPFHRPVGVFPVFPPPASGSRSPPPWVDSPGTSGPRPVDTQYIYPWNQSTSNPIILAPNIHPYPNIGPRKPIVLDYAPGPPITIIPGLSDSGLETQFSNEGCTSLWTYSSALIDTLLRDIYLLFLLRLPVFYFSRVDRIFKDADLTLGQIKEMALQVTAENKGRFRSNLLNTGTFYFTQDISSLPPAYRALKVGWESFIDNLMKEWETLNIVSVLLLAAIMTVFQIHGAGEDPITRYLAFWSLICALVSLLYGCVFIIRFRSMRKPYKAAEWALEVRNSQTILWNGGIMLALPVVWLTWSILTFIACIMSFLWRARANLPDDFVFVIHPSVELGFRIFICTVLGVGVGYGLLILDTFQRYGSKMDEAWRRRVETFVDVYPHHQSHHYVHSPVMSWPGRSVSPSTTNAPIGHDPYGTPPYTTYPYQYGHYLSSWEGTPPPVHRSEHDTSYPGNPHLESPNPSISPNTQNLPGHRTYPHAQNRANETRGRKHSPPRHQRRSRPPSSQTGSASPIQPIPSSSAPPTTVQILKDNETQGRSNPQGTRKLESRRGSHEHNPRPTRRVTIQDENSTPTEEILPGPTGSVTRDRANVTILKNKDRLREHPGDYS